MWLSLRLSGNLLGAFFLELLVEHPEIFHLCADATRATFLQPNLRSNAAEEGSLHMPLGQLPSYVPGHHATGHNINVGDH